MGKKSSPTPPAAPDPFKTIEAQTTSNKEALTESMRLNAMDIDGPTGTTTRYERREDGTPWKQITSLGGDAKNLYDKQMQIGNQLGNLAINRTNQIPTEDFSMDGFKYDPGDYDLDQQLQNYDGGDLPYDPREYGNIDMFNDKVTDAVYDQQMRNLQPTMDRQYDKQKQDLANRGLPTGGEAWKSATEELNRNQGNAMQQASNQAMKAGGAEAQRLQGMEQNLRGTAFKEDTTLNNLNNTQNVDRINLGQTLRSQQVNDNLMARTQAFNEASALLQGAPALTMPTAPKMPTYNLQSPDVIGAHNSAFQNQMSSYNAQAAQQAGQWQGAGSMVGGLASIATKCARHYKEDDGAPERILDRLCDIEVRTWRYKREIEPDQPMHISPYAEDVHKAFGIGDGDTLPLIDLIGLCWKSIQELEVDVRKLKHAARKRIPDTDPRGR